MQCSGIIGTGFIGVVHAHVVRAAGGELISVAASSLEGSALAASRLGPSVVGGSAEALITSDDDDIVHICTPNHLHASLAKRAIAAIGSLVASQVSPGRKNRLWFSLDGTNESISFDQELPDSLWLGTKSETRVLTRGGPSTVCAPSAWDVLPLGRPQGYQDAFTAFMVDVHAKLDGRLPDGFATFADGARANRLTAAVLESAASSEWRALK